MFLKEYILYQCIIALLVKERTTFMEQHRLDAIMQINFAVYLLSIYKFKYTIENNFSRIFFGKGRFF
jgi:hypothetical protein